MVSSERANELLLELERRLARAPERYQVENVTRGAIHLAALLEATGILDSQEADTWGRRLARATTGGSADSLESVALRFRKALDEGRAEWPPRSLDSSTQTVYLAPSQQIGVFRVLSVEAYTNYVAIRWLRLAESRHLGDELDIELSDSEGTFYLVVGASSSGDRRLASRGETIFVPAIPPAVSVLAITAVGEVLEVPLGTPQR